MFRFRAPAAMLAAAIVVSACGDTQLTTPENEGPAPVLNQSGGLQSAESIQDRLARTVPGFGGFYLDESDRPTVYLSATVNRGEAMQALNAELQQLGCDFGQGYYLAHPLEPHAAATFLERHRAGERAYATFRTSGTLSGAS